MIGRANSVAIAIIVALAVPAAVSAAPPPRSSTPQPSSYAPRRTTQHVYGSPIEPPIVGRAHAATHRPTPVRPAAKAAKPGSQTPPKKDRRTAAVPQHGARSLSR
jgi:hypothetical protein